MSRELQPVTLGDVIQIGQDVFTIETINTLETLPNLKATMERVGRYEPVVYYGRRVLQPRQRKQFVAWLSRTVSGEWELHCI